MGHATALSVTATGDRGLTSDPPASPAEGPMESEPPSGHGSPHTGARGERTSCRIRVRALDASLGAGQSAQLRLRLASILRATRLFDEEEVAVALELYDSALGTRHAALGGSVGPTAECRAPRADYLFLGAFTPEDELVGYACYGPTPGADCVFDLYWIAVDPALQGAGIGSSLLDEVERRLLERQARLLMIETSSRSEYAPTRAFYSRRGYGETARVRGFYAPGDDRIIYGKRFHSPGGAGVWSR